MSGFICGIESEKAIPELREYEAKSAIFKRRGIEHLYYIPAEMKEKAISLGGHLRQERKDD